jgi:hypothetical protein
MSAPNNGDGRAGASDGPSVLSNLPRTRPQRSSPRRAAARRSATAAAATPESPPKPERSNARRPRTAARTAAAPSRPAKPKAAKAARGTAGAQRKTTGSRRSAASASKPVPRQGFESEADRARGPVHPPGRTELVASAVEIVGDLAKSGLATGERLLKDVFSRLSPS